MQNMISPEFYDIMGVYLVEYNNRLTNSKMQTALTNLGVVYKQETQVENIRNVQLRKYLNTIHNYFLSKRINFSTGNKYNELIDVYETLIKQVVSFNRVRVSGIDEKKLKLSKLTKRLKVDEHDIFISPSFHTDLTKSSVQQISKFSKCIGEKALFCEKNKQDEIQKGFARFEGMIEQRDQMIQEQSQIIKATCKENSNINTRIESLLSQINFNQSLFLQMATKLNQNTVDFADLAMNAETVSKKITILEDTSFKMLSVLQSINNNLKANSSESPVLATLAKIEHRFDMNDQKMDEISASLKSMKLANDL